MKDDDSGKANFVLAARDHPELKVSTLGYIFNITERALNTWVIDSGASRHLIKAPGLLLDAT
ncbi:hypothetical protein CCR75_000948 [Bremia lactucae]|uniref:Uncharacterized protein n=1 Tax=Bremia lactucae TaxID=4779 RepID=A0A976FLP6_BRELC|nr:hypothetical protein CCR75_000948 [Bremia lactucae]